MHQPRNDYWNATIRVLHYLKGSHRQGFLLRSNTSLQIRAFCDSDWASWCCLTCYFISLGHSPISLKRKKQHTDSWYSVKLNIILWWWLAVNWNGWSPYSRIFVFLSPILLLSFCDNQAALYIPSNLVFSKRTKHIKIDCHFVCEELLANRIAPAYLSINA